MRLKEQTNSVSLPQLYPFALTKSKHTDQLVKRSAAAGVAKARPNRVTIAKHLNHGVAHKTDLNRRLLAGTLSNWTARGLKLLRDGDLSTIDLTQESLERSGYRKVKSDRGQVLLENSLSQMLKPFCRRTQIIVDASRRMFATIPSRPDWLTGSFLDHVEEAVERFSEAYAFSPDKESARGMRRSANFGNNFGGGRKVRRSPCEQATPARVLGLTNNTETE